MKKLLLILLVLITAFAQAQTPVVRNNGVVTAVDYRLHTKSLKIPVYQDSAHALAAAGIDSLGLIFKELSTSKIWVRDSNLVAPFGHLWTQIGTGAGGGFTPSDTGYTRILASPALLQKTIDSMKAVDDARYLRIANNLSEFALSPGSARTNLGLGTAAVKNAPASGNAAAGEVVLGNDSRLSAAAPFDSATAQGVVSPNAFHTEGWYQAHYMQIKDSVRYATFARLYKTMDSISGVYLKNGDSTKYATFQRLYKVADSIGNVYVKRGDSTLYATFARLYKVADSLGHIIAGISGGGGSSYVPNYDMFRMPIIKRTTYAKGVTSTANVTNYTAAGVDTSHFPFTTVGTGLYYGGWMFSGTSGQSITVTTPFGVFIGDSQAAGHPGKTGRLETSPFNYAFVDDVAGTMEYRMEQLTHMKWWNHGIGGQTTRQILQRWDRDALGLVSQNTTPTQTLSRKPDYIVIVAGINDFFNGITAAETEANLEFMAASCQQYGIRCIIFTLPGDEISNDAQLKQIGQVNSWLRSGALRDKYNAGLFDYNQIVWNDGSVNNNNWKRGTWGADDVHLTGTGYDTAAARLFRYMHFPVLDTLRITNDISTVNPVTNLAEPSGITINGVSYTVPSSNKVPITAYIGGTSGTYVSDTVTIAVTSARTLVGAGSQTGIGQLGWQHTNNELDLDTLVTRRLEYVNGNLDPWQHSTTYRASGGTNYPVIDAYTNTATHAFQFYTSGSGSYGIVNGGSNTAKIGNAFFSSYSGAANIGFGTDGSYYGGGTNHQFGYMQVGSNAHATATGYGMMWNNTSSGVRIEVNPSDTKDDLEIGFWTGAAKNVNAANIAAFRINEGYNNFLTINQHAGGIYIGGALNNTASFSGTYFNDIAVRRTVTSLGTAGHRAIITANGDVIHLGGKYLFGGVGDSVGTSSTAIMEIKGKLALTAAPDTNTGTLPGGYVVRNAVNGNLELAPAPSGGSGLADPGSNGILKRTALNTTAVASVGDFPTLNQNTTGTAANLSGTPTLPTGTTANTPTSGDNSTKLATTAYIDGLGIASGKFTSTGTNVANAGTISIGSNSCTYLKVGNIVHVHIDGGIIFTANNTDTRITFSFPFSTTNAAQLNLGHGTISANLATPLNVVGLFQYVNSTTGELYFVSPSSGAGSGTNLTIDFDYTLN